MATPTPKYDMNLMRSFVVVYETRSVTEAANILFVSQPSVSYALAKLRKIFADPLFLRNRAGLEPTAVAEAVYPQMVEAIRMMDSVVQNATEFDAGQTTRTFRLMMTDLALMALFSYIVQAIENLAPQARIEVTLLDVAQLEDRLRRNEIDAAIAVPTFSPDTVVRDHLMDMPYVGVCSTSHPRLSAAPSREALAEEQRIHVSEALGHQHVEQALAELHGHRDPAISLPSYSVLDETLAATENYGVVPLFLGDMFIKRSPVRKFILPFHLEPGHVGLHTLRRVAPSPPVEWLRHVITDALTAYPYPRAFEDYDDTWFTS
ncbi:LysR family transcriptional regulator [Citricoccus sp. SGAir0253]|uniref:LysR family transcriptional regulator n=1 Tax=Citricoccus sp. SGAir0253 TaxID=2567881 RepID=UPI0010CCC052|nr:LysR family transcriptional regulator [Citricoccus sp. SGAir0253]QCU77940.1 LysR family transcriptional regulator [Citricoccus sp. SGAir0253]